MVTSLHKEKMFDCSGSSQHLRISLLWKSFLKMWWGAEFETFSFPAVVGGTDWFSENTVLESPERADLTHTCMYASFNHISYGAAKKRHKVLQGCITLSNLSHSVRFVFC